MQEDGDSKRVVAAFLDSLFLRSFTNFLDVPQLTDHRAGLGRIKFNGLLVDDTFVPLLDEDLPNRIFALFIVG